MPRHLRFDVPNDRMAAAEKGQGVTLNGVAVRGKAPVGRPNGLLGDRVRKEFDRQLSLTQRARLGELTTLRCAGLPATATSSYLPRP